MLLPSGSVGSAELRGGAPATRELDVLDPARTVASVDAVVLSGGSAFGLATASGVMRYLAERGQGYPTAGGPVPIVPAACIFDLLDASGPAPGEADGYEACVAAARDETLATGRRRAGAGATAGEWRRGGGRGGSGGGGIRGSAAGWASRRRRSTPRASRRSRLSTRPATSSPRTAPSSRDRPRRQERQRSRTPSRSRRVATTRRSRSSS